MQLRTDGLSNALTGIGGMQDRTRTTEYTLSYLRPDQELTAIWTSNGLGRKVCSLQIDDMIRQWIEIPEDPEGKLLKELDRLKVRETIQRLLYWTDLYKGAVGVMILGDGSTDLANPLQESKTPAPLKAIRVYPVTDDMIQNDQGDIVADPSSEYFGDLETIKVTPIDAGGFQAHVTRCLVSKGAPVPDSTGIDWKYRYWGISRLQAVFDDLTAYNVSMNAFANLIHQATIGKLKLNNLGEIVADNDTAAERLKGVMDNVARSVSYLNMILMGEGDSFERDQLSLGGWREVSQMFRENLAAVTGYSTSVLFETASSSGLSASSAEDSATERYYNSVKVRQETDLRPLLAQIIRHVAPMVGLDPEIEFKFRNLHEPTAKEVAEIRKIHAETDKVRIEAGIIFAPEARSRLEGDTYGDEVTLEPGYEAKGPDEIAAEKALEAAQLAASKAPMAPVAQKPLQMPTPPKPKTPAPKGKK